MTAFGILWDDPQPSIADTDPEITKAYGDVGENRMLHARFAPAKLKRNEFSALLLNLICLEAEPSKGSVVADEHILAMLTPMFGSMLESHKMAILKRYVTIVFGAHGIYVRLPSEHTLCALALIFRTDPTAKHPRKLMALFLACYVVCRAVCGRAVKRFVGRGRFNVTPEEYNAFVDTVSPLNADSRDTARLHNIIAPS
jgi:hypothetical protein